MGRYNSPDAIRQFSDEGKVYIISKYIREHPLPKFYGGTPFARLAARIGEICHGYAYSSHAAYACLLMRDFGMLEDKAFHCVELSMTMNALFSQLLLNGFVDRILDDEGIVIVTMETPSGEVYKSEGLVQ